MCVRVCVRECVRVRVCVCVSAISLCDNAIFFTGSKNNTSKKNYILQKL